MAISIWQERMVDKRKMSGIMEILPWVLVWAGGCSAVPRPRQRGHVRIFMEIWSPGGRYTLYTSAVNDLSAKLYNHGEGPY